MSSILELNEFFIQGGDSGASHVLLHITEPATPEEKRKGFLFAFAEVRGATEQQIGHIAQLIDDLESAYYEMDDEGPDDPFETTLEFMNKRSSHILDYEDASVSLLVGVLRKKELSFAYHGEPYVHIIYRGKGGYNNINLIEEPQDGDALFGELLSGTLGDNDYMLLSTPSVEDYLSIDRVKKILHGRTTRQAASHIQKTLDDLGNGTSFGGLIVRLLPRTAAPKSGKRPTYTDEQKETSPTQILETEKETNEILNPPLIGSLLGKKKPKKKKPSSNKQTTKAALETNHRQRDLKAPMGETILVSLGKALVRLGKLLGFLLLKFVDFVRNLFTSLFVLITNRGSGRKALIGQYQKSWNKHKTAFTNLPLLSKILLIATIIFAVFFFSSIFYLKAKENREAKHLAYTNLVQAIEDKTDAANARILYDDVEAAMSLLKEAETLLGDLPTDNAEQADTANQLRERVTSALSEVQSLNDIAFDTVATLDSPADKIAKVDDSLFVYSTDQSTFYKVNALTGSVETRDQDTFAAIRSADTPKENDFVLVLTGNQEVAELDKEAFTLSAKEIGVPNNNAELADFTVYNRRLYSLDPRNSQIYRHNPTQAGYDAGTEWVTQTTVSLADGVGIAIDGDIFVLKRNGEIAKYAGGKEQRFSISGLEPALNEPTDIWTYNDTEFLFVLEPSNKRVVMLDKFGNVVEQFTSSQWNEPTGMVVDTETEKVYLVDGEKIYSFQFTE